MNTRASTNAADSRAIEGGALGLIGAIAEQTKAEGTYHGILHRAKPQHEREYLQLLGHVDGLRKTAMARQRLLGRFIGKAASRHLVHEADEASAYMRTLMEVQRDDIVAPNLVTTVGKNYLLDNGLAGSSFTAAFYLGLISSTSYSAVNAADTMSSHSGWLESGIANTPTYSESTRRTAAWSAASSGSKALSAGLVFTFTGTGTVKGCFLTTVSTKDGTTGTLYSAGSFTGGDQPVVSTNTLTVSYTASL